MKTIAIFLHGQQGDIMEASCVLKYRNELWGEHKLVWYIDDANKDLLKYQDVELRTFPRGFGYPQMVIEENKKLIDAGKEPVWEDWLPLVDENNHLNLELAKKYPSLNYIDYGFFPAPHQIPVHKRHNIEYSNCSKKVFGIPDSYEWHPVLFFSAEEIMAANKFMAALPNGKNICIESFAGSGQSLVSHEQIKKAMEICNEILGKCNFIFMSHKYLRNNETFPDELLAKENVYFASHFTVRQCALIVGLSDLLLSVSSGITVAASCWENTAIETLQYCGSLVCSTKSVSLDVGKFNLITTDDKPLLVSVKEFEYKLIEILNSIK